MKLILFIVSLLFGLSGFSQTPKDPVEMTPQLQAKIKNNIELLVPPFKRNLEKYKMNSTEIEFAVDTFCVEKFMEKWIEVDYTDAGMSEGAYAGARLYDSLLNKYYKKLLAVLKADDKKTLIQAQKAWIQFRDSEYKLIETISKDEYSGGGTIQQLNDSGDYLNLVKTRTIAIYEHYARATRSE